MTTAANGKGQSGAASFRRGGKTISGKLSSFLNSKSGHINGFSLELDEPVKEYGPGDSVKGKVILDVARPLGVAHITLCLYGYVQVFKANSRPKPPVRSNGSRVAKGRSRRWVSEYYGDGFASLFEDEIVLCQEGTLAPQIYHFHFVIDFPSGLELPTSVDFERGTVSYMVSATITRPGGIAPSINTVDTKVRYRDNIDVSRYSIPRPRIATLEPVDQLSRTKLKRLASYGPESKRGSTTLTDQSSRTGCSEASKEQTESPPTPSAVSVRSDLSGGDRNRKVSWDRSSARLSHSTKTDCENRPSKIITCTVELLRGACLPGDVVNVKVSVEHTKPVRALNGIIVTLYRQGRVDMHPNLPLAQTDGDRTIHYEDYYPRSRTGLGGLSLSAAGSSQVWRKDISQTFAPLFVDPHTLTATVKVPIRVPDELYLIPSIRNAPGEMISFKYMVEVIVDIHGKLGVTDRVASNLSTTMLQTPYNGDRHAAEESREHSVTAVGAGCMDTTAIRRNKAAVTHVCDLVVGTTDSERRSRVKEGKAPATDTPVSAPQFENGHSYEHEGPDAEYAYDESYDYYYGHDYGYGYNYPPAHANGYHHNPDYNYDHYDYGGYDYPPDNYNTQYPYNDHPGFNGHYPPMPAMTNGYIDPNLSEKERMRQFEDSLQPSRPADSASTSRVTPTAPTIPSDRYTPGGQQASDETAPPAWQPPLHDSSVNDFAHPQPSSTLPSSPSTSRPMPAHTPTDDKAELERRRLAQPSAPPPTDRPPSSQPVPSAPPPEMLNPPLTPVATVVRANAPQGQDGHGDESGGGASAEAQQLLETPSNVDALPKYEQ